MFDYTANLLTEARRYLKHQHYHLAQGRCIEAMGILAMLHEYGNLFSSEKVRLHSLQDELRNLTREIINIQREG